MKLAFYTNIPSHYQISLGQAFSNLLPGNFSLVCWTPVSEERKKLNWRENFENDWLIKAWTSSDAAQKAHELIHSADIVIWGSGPLDQINDRVVQDKLTFRYTERPFKRGRWRLLDPRVFISIWNGYKYSVRKSYHLLSVGPYCADDFRLLGAFKDRMWRWGYFPEIPSVATPKKQNEPPVILWAGRMLSWKRVDLLLAATKWARVHGAKSFRLRIIGTGPEEGRLKA